MAKMSTIVCAAVALSLGRMQGAAAVDELELDFYARVWGVEGTAEQVEGEQACLGNFQSPVNLKGGFSSLDPLPEHLVTRFNFPTIKDPFVSNTGHNIQMNWDTATAFDMTDKDQFPQVPAGGSGIRDVLADPSVQVDRMLTMIPIQMHWHVTSEHSWDGLLGAAEGHIVTYVAEGDAPDWGCDVVWGDDEVTDEEGARQLANCIAVFGVFYRLSEEEYVDNNDFFLELEETANVFVDESGQGTDLPENPFDLNKLVPADKSYYTYIGSLTTPPCSEGLRWHVFNDHAPMTREVFTALELHTARTAAAPGETEQLYRHNNRDIQAFGEARTMYFADSGAAVIPGVCGAEESGAYGY